MHARKLFIVLTAAGFGLGATSEALAQFGDFQRTFFRGIQYFGNRTFISNPQGGPLFDNNIYDQRIEYNRTGRGWTFENFRFFGPDSFDNPNTLDLGPIKIQLGPDPTVVANAQPIGVHNRVGYTTALIPEVFYEMETGQRGFDQFSGLTSFRPAPINYSVTVNTGVQDFEWAGNAIIQSSGRINALGFYDFNLQFTNVGSYTADGFLVHDDQVTDFDTGPVNLSGHILFDALASIAQAFGQTDAAAIPRSISGATGTIDSSKQKIEELMTRLESGEQLSDEEMNFLIQQMFIAAFEQDPLGFIQNGMPAHVEGFESLTMTVSEEQSEEIAGTVPEPGTLLLMGSALVGVAAARKRRSRSIE